MTQTSKRIVLTGGAGLVGQNLIVRLKQRGYTNIVVIDKHQNNLSKLKALQPHVQTTLANLSKPGAWRKQLQNAHVVVMLHAQIGGNNYEDFHANNIQSTKLVINAVKEHNIDKLIHISSSVVQSVADDYYTRSKTDQEQLVLKANIPSIILRPTLMFGWFDRKHLGWLARFMKTMPIFPIPGNGRFMRQPLYAGDFCNIIISCIENKINPGIYDISGQEQVDYIDIIRKIKAATASHALILKIPYKLFYYLLWIWGIFDKNPPFTTQQLAALVANDQFDVIDWPNIFGVRNTPFSEAIIETFCDSQFSKVIMEF